MESRNNFIIKQATEYSSELAEAVRSLVQQLDNNYRPLSDEDVRDMVHSSCNRLIVAHEHATGKIVGMLTLLVYRIPYTKKAMIEDVVVDKEFRRSGIGTSLVTYALEQAKREHAVYIDLTSRPSRVNANEFYQKIGFNKRETNVYRLML